MLAAALLIGLGGGLVGIATVVAAYQLGRTAGWVQAMGLLKDLTRQDPGHTEGS